MKYYEIEHEVKLQEEEKLIIRIKRVAPTELMTLSTLYMQGVSRFSPISLATCYAKMFESIEYKADGKWHVLKHENIDSYNLDGFEDDISLQQSIVNVFCNELLSKAFFK